MTRGRRVAGWGLGIVLVALACSSSNQTGDRQATAPSDAQKAAVTEPTSPEPAETSSVVPAPPASSSGPGVVSSVHILLVRRWFHEICVRPPPEPPAVAARSEEPKKPTALGARLDALGSPPEAPRTPDPPVNPWYAPQCNYVAVPVSICGVEPGPLKLACDQQRAACETRLDEAALRRVPKRAELEIDRRGEAHGVTIYQNGKKLDDDDLEEAVLCLFVMTPGEITWALERCR